MSHKNNRGRIRGSRRLRSVVGGLLAIGAWALGVAVPAVADYEAGLRAWEKGDFASALVELRKSADAGDKRAQDHLGMMFEDGEGVPRSNQTAAYWYQQSAEQGHAQAQLNLGRMYRNGKGVPQDDKQAVAWYRRAAAQGLAVAQFFLGLMYDTGKGVDASASHAYMWFSLAAEQGDQDAAF
nr:sel1 repeat family protein [Gammaproteobacteria bacterium]